MTAVIPYTTFRAPTPLPPPVSDVEISLEELDPLVGQRSLFAELQAVQNNDPEFHNKIYLLSQFVRFASIERSANKAENNTELLKQHVCACLTNYGYARTERDPNVWLNPQTKSEGWIIELPEGDGLWHGPFIVAGHFDGIVSRDLKRAITRAKKEIFNDLIDVVKHCRNLLTDRLVMLFESPWFELRTEIRNPSDIEPFFEKHPDLEPFFAALFSFSQPAVFVPDMECSSLCNESDPRFYTCRINLPKKIRSAKDSAPKHWSDSASVCCDCGKFHGKDV